jgi:DNA-binding transcriptional LysR family regulator
MEVRGAVGINRGLLDLRRLVVLREVARTGTISGAAEALTYSSSAVSQLLTRLQADLGVQLLDHVGRNVILTPAAALLVDRLEVLLDNIEDIDAELAAAGKGGHQRVRIGSFQSFTTIYVAALVEKARQREPRLELHVRQVEPEAAMAELLSRRLDLVVIDEFSGFPAPRAARMHREFVTSEELVPYFPRGLPAGEEADPAVLAWVCEPRGTATYDLVVSRCREHGFEPRITFETVDFETHRQLVEAGAAAAFLPETFLRDRDHGLRRITALAEPLERLIYTVVREGSQHYPSIKLVRELIRERFAAP